MNQFYISLKSKSFIGMKVFLLSLILTTISLNGSAQNYQSFDASTTNAWTATKWSPSSATNACVSSGLTNAFVSGRIVYLCTVNGTGSGAVGITIGGIIATENYTHSSPSGTLTTGGTVATVDVASGKTVDLGSAAFSTAAGTGFIKNGVGIFSEGGGAYTGGFTLNNGTIAAAGVNAMGAGGTLTINGGTISGTNTRDFSGKFSGGITVNNDFSLGSTISPSLGTANLTFTNNTSFGSSTRTITLGGSGTYKWGAISGSGSAGLTINATAAGTFLLGATSTYTGATTVTAGTLACGIANAIPSSSNVVLNGGTLKTGIAAGFTQPVGTLALTANSTLGLGTGSHSLTFANSSAVSWTGGTVLTITGWLGSAGSSGIAGQVYIGAGGLTSTQLGQVTFSGFSPGAIILGTGELVPAVTAITSTQNGPWTTGSTWVGGVVPLATDNVVINHAVTAAAQTRNAGTTTLVNSGASLAVSGTYANNGSTTINGTFQLDAGGFASGNNLLYAATGSYLVFNGGSVYGVNGTPAYWPTASGPYNVSVNTSSGFDLQAGVGARTIAGTLSTYGQVNVSTAGYLVIGGTLQLNTNGFINTNSPNYSTGSTLQYNSGSTYGRNLEWTSASASVGTPYNVLISNSTTLNYPINTVSAQTVTNNLTINAGSALYMDYLGVNSNGALTVGNNFSLIGSFSEGNTNGDDLIIGGNMSFTSGYGFFANGRAVIFTKNGTQVISVTGAVPPVFAYLNISPTTAGTVQLGAGADISITAPGGGNVISFTNAGDIFDLNGHTLTLGTALTGNVISGPGSFKGSTASNLMLLGTGSIGTLKFTSGFQNLGTLTLNRSAAAVAAVLGSDLTINTSIALSFGLLNVNTNNLIFTAAATSSGATGNSFIEADGTGTVRKIFTTAGSFTYPVGDGPASANGAEFSPAILNFTGGSFSSAYAGLTVTNLKQPNNAAPVDYINRYWSVSSSGITSPTYNFTATYTNADISGTETNSYSGRWDGSSWTVGAPLASNTVSVTGNNSLTATNDFTGGNPLATPLVTITNTGTPAATNIGQGVNNVSLTSFNIGSNWFNDFTAVTLTNSGTATSSDLSNLRIIYDANSNGVLDAGEITGNIVGASMPYSGSINFSITGQLNYSGTRRFFVIADVTLSAISGDYVVSSVASAADVTTSITNKTGNAIGNQQTIAAISLASDYFKSNGAGNWAVQATWLSSHDNVTYFPATLVPTSAANTITIVALQTVVVNSNISLDQLVINGTLDVQTGAVLNINDGTGSDIAIPSGGVLNVSASSAAAYSAMFLKSPVTASIDVATGGRILISNSVSVPGTIQTFASDINNTWAAGSIFEYNAASTTLGTTNVTFFPNSAAGVSPILRITAMAGTPGGSSQTTINGILEVNSSFTFVGTGAKTFRDGITGSATLTISSAVTGTVTIGGTTTPVLGGTATLGLVLQRSVTLPVGITVPSTAIVNVTSSPANMYGFTKTSGSFLVSGTIDLSDVSITNTSGNVTVNGILKTSNTSGFYNPGNIASGTVVLGGASTIEYNAAGAQSVSIRSDYNNITITGTGIKTLAATSTVSPITGTVTVNAGAALDVANNTFGSGSTNLTLVTTGKFLNAGSGVKPDMGGTYTLGTGSTIQFDGTSATLVRLVNYYNLYITGTNVSTSTNTAVISLQNGGTFTVAAGAKFKTRSANGFSGGAATSVGNATTPSIVLSPTSTIDYFEPIAQAITNQQAYGNLEISAASGTKTAPATLSILGNIIKSGAAVFAPNSGTVSLDGTALQSYAAIDSMDFYKLINNNSTGFKVGDNLLTVGTAVMVNGGSFGIQNLLTLSSGSKLTFGAGSISMRSSATSTAAIDKMTSATAANINYTGAGRFRIERYVGYNRKWQLLSVPVTETGHTIRTDWMEGSAAANDNLVPGYGMQVTDERVNATALGFDAKSVSGPSVKSYNPASDTYTGIATPGATITTDAGFFAYVRGDRTSLNTPSTTVATRLRTAGRIRDGNDVTVSNGAATTGKFQVVGNPYASAVDARLISGANVTSSGAHPDIYVWDPTIYGGYGVGKFVLLSYNAGNYTADDATGLYNASAVNNFIQSGQAFMVKSSGGTGSVTFHDADKTTASNDVSFTAGHGQTLRTSMYSIDNGTTANGADGALVIFGDDQNSSLDNSDALKMLNTADNLSFKTGGKLIGIERRHTIISNDTLQLSISAMRAVKYRFVIAADNLDAPGRQGWLIDRAVNSSMPLNLAGETSYDFIINNVASSYAADRFIIVFKQIPAARFISVNASADNNKTISVAWQVANENNVSSYSVEQSGNGHEFTGISNVSLVQNNNLTASYNLADAHSLKDADNYFRVKMTLATGAILYSDLVKVGRISDAVYATVSPNPVTDKTIHLQLSNQDAGNYSLQLINEAGAIVYKGSITVSSFFETKNVSLEKSIAAGVYTLIMSDENAKKNVLRVTIL